jgi:hypothetical protein
VEQGPSESIIKLAPIIALNGLDGAKLSENI